MPNERSFTGYRGTSYQPKLVPCSNMIDTDETDVVFIKPGKMEKLVASKASMKVLECISIVLISYLFQIQ